MMSEGSSDADKSTGLVYHHDFLKHDTGAYHPERAARLTAIIERLESSGLSERLVRISPEPAALEQIEYVHERSYIESVRGVCERGGGMLDPDTPVSAASYEVALLAAGGVIKAVEEVLNGNLKSVFAAVRPPGHHAERSRGMGFCIFNNVAIAAEHLKRRGLRRILIVDWDVHHGNGTQNAFYEDASVLYFSTHQYPYYPGTGWLDEVGSGDGRGFTVNVPLPAGCGDPDYIYVFKEVLAPIAAEFRPEFVLISAGFDPHASDPLAGMWLSSRTFGVLTEVIKGAVGGGGRIVVSLEGGYSLNALAESVQYVLEALRDEFEGGGVPEAEARAAVRNRVAEIKRIQREYWGL